MSLRTEGSAFAIGDKEGMDEADGDAAGLGRTCAITAVSILRVLCNDSDGLFGDTKI